MTRQNFRVKNPLRVWITNQTLFRFFLMFLLSLVCLNSITAQSQAPSTPADISARLKELADPEKNIPENQILLSDELHRIDDELGRNRTTVASYETAQKNLEQLKGEASKLFQDIDALNCDQVSVTPAEAAKLDELANSILEIVPSSSELNPWAAIDAQSEQKVPPKAQCQKIKDAIGDQTQRQNLLSFIDRRIKEYDTTKTQLISLIEALQKRRAALLQHWGANTAQTKVGGDLWLIILAIGALSIGTIIATRLFTPEIQNQWVMSGQIIQFVTVMILLSVIMALGLASILKENTLGTLLGGIAGYVLSQGVGKAAAAAVTQGIAAAGGAIAGGALAAITLTSLSPTTGPSGGGASVKIVGSGFLTGAKVTFGGTPATVGKITDTTIELTTPQHAAGPVEVVVTNTNSQTAKLPNGFTYE
jgi:hypothetical protein